LQEAVGYPWIDSFLIASPMLQTSMTPDFFDSVEIPVVGYEDRLSTEGASQRAICLRLLVPGCMDYSVPQLPRQSL
jgi:hypothetical protein